MVEIAPKPFTLIQTLPTWRWFLWASIAFFVIVVLSYVGLRLYLARLQDEVLGLNNQIKEAAAAVNAEDEQTVVRFNESLNTLRSLFANHTYFSSFLSLINSSTYPKVSYNSVQAEAVKNSIQLKGSAQSYTALAKQIVALRENPMILGVAVSGITFGVKNLQFDLKVDVKPDIFRQQK